MVKYFFLLSVTLGCWIAAFSQYFEGEIVYEYKFTTKVSGLSVERLKTLMGTRQEYYIKEGSYKSLANGSLFSAQIYDKNTNTIYSIKPGTDTLFWIDASMRDDSVLSYEVQRNKEVILGNNCDAVVLKTVGGTTTFYFSRNYELNSAEYKKHTYGNWAFLHSCRELCHLRSPSKKEPL